MTDNSEWHRVRTSLAFLEKLNFQYTKLQRDFSVYMGEIVYCHLTSRDNPLEELIDKGEIIVRRLEELDEKLVELRHAHDHYINSNESENDL